jgi:hypothetical protein
MRMNINQAKQILQGHHDGMVADSHEDLEEALSLLESHEELQTWYEKELAFNHSFRSAMESIQPPAHLRDSILRAMVAEQPAASDPSVSISDEGKPNTLFNWVLPLAAAAALIAALAIFLPGNLADPELSAEPMPELIAYLDQTLINQKRVNLESRSNSLPELKAYLAAHNTPSIENPPNEILEMSPIGCLKVTFREVNLGLICFDEGEKVYHLLSAERADMAILFPELQAENLPAIFESGETSYKVWVDDANVNILTHYGSNDDPDLFF